MAARTSRYLSAAHLQRAARAVIEARSCRHDSISSESQMRRWRIAVVGGAHQGVKRRPIIKARRPRKWMPEKVAKVLKSLETHRNHESSDKVKVSSAQIHT